MRTPMEVYNEWQEVLLADYRRCPEGDTATEVLELADRFIRELVGVPKVPVGGEQGWGSWKPTHHPSQEYRMRGDEIQFRSAGVDSASVGGATAAVPAGSGGPEETPDHAPPTDKFRGLAEGEGSGSQGGGEPVTARHQTGTDQAPPPASSDDASDDTDWANARGAGSSQPSAAVRGRGEPSHGMAAEQLSPANPAPWDTEAREAIRASLEDWCNRTFPCMDPHDDEAYVVDDLMAVLDGRLSSRAADKSSDDLRQGVVEAVYRYLSDGSTTEEEFRVYRQRAEALVEDLWPLAGVVKASSSSEEQS